MQDESYLRLKCSSIWMCYIYINTYMCIYNKYNKTWTVLRFEECQEGCAVISAAAIYSKCSEETKQAQTLQTWEVKPVLLSKLHLSHIVSRIITSNVQLWWLKADLKSPPLLLQVLKFHRKNKFKRPMRESLPPKKNLKHTLHSL